MSTQRIQQLAVEITKHNALYAWGAAEITDTAYDLLVEELRALDPMHVLLQSMFDAAPATGGVTHATPMLSLAKCYDMQALVKWCKTVKGGFVVQPKYDGTSCELEYVNGKLLRASTRGDGTTGEDVTHNVRYVNFVPKKIGHDRTTFNVRGELYMPRSTFALHYTGKFANTRNVVAGAVGRKTPNKSLLSHLHFIAYDLVETVSAGDTHDQAALEMLKVYGFQVPHSGLTLNADYVPTLVQIIIDTREHIDCDLDGVVVKADMLATRREMGSTGHHPKWAMAFKLQGDSGKTTLEDVKWQTSRTGTITPVAVFKAVTLSGASVTEATLHHRARMESMHLTVGDVIEVTRRGGVIPHVERVVDYAGESAPFAVPVVCPACNNAVRNRGDFLECVAPSKCVGVAIAKLEHWCKTTGMLGFGPAVCAQLYNEGIYDPSMLYEIDADWKINDALGSKTGAALLAEIEKTTVIPLATFLQALGIDTLGSTVSSKLAERYTLEQLLSSVNEEQLSTIPGIGETIAEAVVCGLEDNEELIDKLSTRITLTRTTAPISSGSMSGMVFVFTGEVEGMTREECQAQVKALGAVCPSGITKTTTHFVIGNNAGATKRAKADAYNAKGANIAIMSSDEFIALLNASMPVMEPL